MIYIICPHTFPLRQDLVVYMTSRSLIYLTEAVMYLQDPDLLLKCKKQMIIRTDRYLY